MTEGNRYSGRRVLVVEDDYFIVQEMIAWLEENGTWSSAPHRPWTGRSLRWHFPSPTSAGRRRALCLHDRLRREADSGPLQLGAALFQAVEGSELQDALFGDKR
ncbi:hypothetical protein [Rhizobium mongolense]